MSSLDRKISGKISVENSGKIQVSGELETKPHPDVLKESKNRERIEDRRFYIGLAINGITLGAVALATVFAGRQAKSASGQLIASREQTTLAERPWISYDAEKDSSFYFDENGANLRMKFRLHNSGQTPATNVHTFVGFIGRGLVNSDKEADKKFICEKGIESIGFSQETLFPNADTVQTRKFRMAPEVVSQFTKNGNLQLHIISCVVYKSTLEDMPIYTTGGLVYEVGPKPRTEFPFNPGIRANVDIPIEDLVIDVEGATATLQTGGETYHSHADDQYSVVEKNSRDYLNAIEPGGTADAHTYGTQKDKKPSR